MMSLDLYTRPSSPLEKKAKEAEDIVVQKDTKLDYNGEDESILLRRTISLLNAQQAVHKRETQETFEKKDRDMMILQNELTNMQQTLASERLTRKKAEEKIEILEDEVHKLRRLVLAYKSKIAKQSKSDLTSSAGIERTSMEEEERRRCSVDMQALGETYNENMRVSLPRSHPYRLELSMETKYSENDIFPSLVLPPTPITPVLPLPTTKSFPISRSGSVSESNLLNSNSFPIKQTSPQQS